MDILSLFIASLCHDFKHTGQNNIYHVNCKSNLAIRYNDASVLENYHVSETFKTLLKEENNIMKNFSPEEYRIARRRIIECIIATDMTFHAKHIATIKAKMETFDIKKGKNLDKMIFPENLTKTFENQQMLLNLCLHSADISSPAKSYPICKEWTDRIYIEFFAQGDAEKNNGLPVSLLCDRETTNTNKSQVGFITFIVAPTFETLLHFIPEIYPYMDNIKSNQHIFEDFVKDDEMKQLSPRKCQKDKDVKK